MLARAWGTTPDVIYRQERRDLAAMLAVLRVEADRNEAARKAAQKG
jgi:hypothetical protein